MTSRRLWFPALIVLATAIPLVVAMWHGLGRPFTLTPDADLIYMGEALRGLDGRPYFYTDHPGYTYVLLLSLWLKILGMLGLIPYPGLAAAVAAPAIEPYMQAMIWAGRLLSAMLAAAYVGAAAGMVRLAGASRPATLFFAWALACSAGIAHQAVILRAELLSAGFTFLCFAAVMIAGRRSGWATPLWLAAAGAFAAWALEAKVQALIPLVAVPILAIAVGTRRAACGPACDDWRTAPALVGALAILMPTATVAAFSRADFDFGPPVGPYQLLLLGGIAAAMLAYARLYAVATRTTILAVLSLATGGAVGFSTLFLRHSHRVVDAVVNPIEHMRVFSRAAAGAGVGIAQAVLDSAAQLATTFVLSPPSLPLRTLEIAVVLVIPLLWRRGDRQPAILAMLLVGVAVGVELIFGLRGVFKYYLVYLEAWVLLAVAVAGDRLVRAPGPRRLALAAAMAVIAWSGAQALAPEVVPVQPVANLCTQADIYLEPDLAIRFAALCRAAG